MVASHSDTLGNKATTRLDTCGSTDNGGGCSPGEGSDNCTYECGLLHELPPEYNSSCEFIEANCADEYELLNYLQFMDCHLGPNVRVCTFRASMSGTININYYDIVCNFSYSHLDISCWFCGCFISYLFYLQRSVHDALAIHCLCCTCYHDNRLTTSLFLCFICFPTSFVYPPVLRA